MVTSRFEVHARRSVQEKGERAHIQLKRIHIGAPNDGFDVIELWVDGKDLLVLFIDNEDYSNFPTYDSNNDKGAW